MKKLLSNALIRLIVVVGLLLLIRYVSKELGGWVNETVDNITPCDFDYESSLYKLFMIIFSFAIMFAIPGYSLKDFGFRKPEKVNYFKIFWLTLVIVVGGLFIFGFLYMGVLQNLFGDGGEPSIGFDTEQSFISVVLLIWIWSSITEEIYMRGLFQSLLDNLKKYKFIRLSAAVWISGIAFGLLHLSLYNGGNLFFTLFIVTQATILGVLAAYYREKTKSIYIAILIHILANIYGSVPSLFM